MCCLCLDPVMISNLRQLTKWMTLKNLVVEDIGIALIECDIGTLVSVSIA